MEGGLIYHPYSFPAVTCYASSEYVFGMLFVVLPVTVCDSRGQFRFVYTTQFVADFLQHMVTSPKCFGGNSFQRFPSGFTHPKKWASRDLNPEPAD